MSNSTSLEPTSPEPTSSKKISEQRQTLETLDAVPSCSYFQPRLLKSLWPKPARKFSALNLPNKRVRVENVRFDNSNFEQFKKVCGFEKSLSHVPISYPHMLAFGMHLHLFTEPDFPLPVLGLIHTQNHIERFKHTPIDENYNLEVYLGNLRPHAKGANFEVISEYSRAAKNDSGNDEVVWREHCTLLARLPKKLRDFSDEALLEFKSADTPRPQYPCSDQAEVWKVAGDTGRKYGAVSADRNPIHLYPITAKLFGFPRHIAHGMWTLAKSNAAIESQFARQSIDCERLSLSNNFIRPMFLPATAHHYTKFENNKTQANLEVWNRSASTLHMSGHAKILDA